MSRASDIALMYEKSKTAMLLGLGYIAAKDPIRAIRIGVRVSSHLTKQLLVDTGAYSKIIKEEILDPEVADARKWYSSNRIPAGTLVTVSPWIAFVLFGATSARASEQIWGEDRDISGGLENNSNLF